MPNGQRKKQLERRKTAGDGEKQMQEGKRPKAGIRKKRGFLAVGIVLLLLLCINIFCSGSRFLFREICARRETAWPDLGAADDVQYGILTEAYRIRKEEPAEHVTVHAGDGTQLAADYYERKEGAPVVLYFHGYRSHAVVDGIPAYRITEQLNWNLLLAASRAHGKSGGDYCGMGVLERYDCRDWAAWAAERFGAETPLFLMGVSMSGTAVMMSSSLDLPESVCGIIDDCGYDSFPEMLAQKVREKTSAYFPVSLFVFALECGAWMTGGFHFSDADACSALAQTDIPLLMIHSDADTTVPLSSAYRLYDSCRSEKQIKIIHGADHGENYRVDPDGYEETVIAFLRKYARSGF